jgi:hypothetical protein
VADADGGSGTRSIAENRKARAQSLNDATFDGDRDRGSGRAIDGRLSTACDIDADAPALEPPPAARLA